MNLLLKNNYFGNLFIGVISFIAVGCGSGGSDLLRGQFVDDPVAGLRYSTPTISGETNANGEFQYQTGETVSFYVGDILLGQAPGAAIISPLDLAGMAVPNTALEIRREANRANNNGRKQGTPLEVAANIAVFLQTLDADDNINDLIQIPVEMHVLAAGMSLDFNQRRRDFRKDYFFRKLLASGRSAGLWGGSRAIRNTSYALDALYGGLGLTSDIKAVSTIKINDNNDGTPDRILTYTYDANGNLTREEVDNNGGGTPDRILTYTYDANGNLTREEVDDSGFSTQDSINTYTYDANGNLTREEIDENGDGTPEWIVITTYDANGDRTRAEVDYNNDGTPDSINTYTYTYDANGNLTREEVDANDDGTPDRIVIYTYDANGNWTKVEYDYDGDGNPDSIYIYTYTYDANGNWTKVEMNVGDDGTPHRINTYTYDANGNQTKVEYDFGGDGAWILTYIYDTNGNQTREENDYNGDGTLDSINTHTHIYDTNGNRTREEIDIGDDGTPDWIIFYTYESINRWAALLND